MASAQNERPATASSGSASSENGTIHTTKRSDRSKFMKLLQSATQPVMTRLPPFQEEYPPGSPQLDAHKSAEKHCDVHERVVEDIYIYDLIPKNTPAQDATIARRRSLYYLAGGSWCMPPSKPHWAFCAELAKQLPDTRVSVVSTPLAPKSPAPDAFPQLMKMYRQLLRDAAANGEQVILAGDSSGGNQILCLAADGIKEDPSAPAPAALVAICPSVDLRQSNLEQMDVEPNDPILRITSSREYADRWRGSWAAVDERINPLWINWQPIAKKGVKIHGVVAGNDILRPDALKLRDKLNDAGVEGEWLDWENQMHAYPLTFPYGLREGKETKDWIIDVIGGT